MTCSILVTIGGAACLAASTQVPLGIAFFALAALGAFAVVAGLFTLLALLVGQLLGLGRRSDQVVRHGRRRILLPGTKAPQGQPAAEAATKPASEPDVEVTGVLDLSSRERQPTRV